MTTVRDFLVSPLQAVLGYRPTGAGGNLGFIPKGSESTLEFVALGPDLGRADPGELTFSVAERRYVTSLVTDKDGRYRYDETPVDREIASSKLSLIHIFGIQKSASHRFLNTLKYMGYVEQTPQSDYALTGRLRYLAEGVVPRIEVRNFARPYLEELSKAAEQPSNLSLIHIWAFQTRRSCGAGWSCRTARGRG